MMIANYPRLSRFLSRNGSQNMTLTLELSQDLERRLATEAMRQGLPVEQYALQLLGDIPKAEAVPANGAELVSFWRREGVIGSRPDIENSQVYARKIRRQR